MNILVVSYFCFQTDCEYLWEPPRRGGFNDTHNLCLGAEIRKLIFTPVSPVYYIKVGFKLVKTI